MGHPKAQRKQYKRPFRPYDKDRLSREKAALKAHGLKRKKEIWRAQEMLRSFRQRARELQAAKNEEKEKILLEKLNKMGLRCTKLEDVLGIDLDKILERRLQTIVYKKGFASTSKQARQIILHGHIFLLGRKIRWPSYIIPVDLEGKIELDPAMKSKSAEKPKGAENV